MYFKHQYFNTHSTTIFIIINKQTIKVMKDAALLLVLQHVSMSPRYRSYLLNL